MATIKEELKSNINNPRLISPIVNLPPNAVTYGEMTNGQVLQSFESAKNLLNGAIEDGSYDDLPYVKRIELRDYIRKASDHTSINVRFENLDRFVNSVRTSGLYYHREVFYHGEAIEMLGTEGDRIWLQSIRERLDKLDISLNNLEELQAQIVNKQQQFPAQIQNTEEYLREIELQRIHTNELLLTVQKQESDIGSILENAKETEQEIETKKLSISTFSGNIEEYRVNIESIEKKAQKVIDQDSKIKNLINQSEIALQLTSAEGISGAFASQYAKASNQYTLYGWIAGVLSFIVAAIWITVSLIKETKTDDPGKILNPLVAQYPWIVLVGRAVSVSICLSVAAFFARQYTKQKNIAEDYAYKSVLAKSIVAFSKEISKVDEEKAADYLATVLEEIHKDPLRIKMSKSDSLSTIDIESIVSKVTDAINKRQKE